MGEMYLEGWGLPFPTPLRYLGVGAVCLAFTLVALTWPRVGGWSLILFGGAFSAWWTSVAAGRGWRSLEWILGTLLPFGGLLVGGDVLFLMEGRYRRQRRAEELTLPKEPALRLPKGWFRRNLRYVLAIGFPLLVTVAASVYFAPMILTRVDDGDRGTRLIQGNGVTLIWAPKGPGWNWK